MKEAKINHVAIIMDGNRRWATLNNLPKFAGHKAGIDTLEKIVKICAEQKIKFLTTYALSTENIKEREKEELKDLFNLIKEGFVNKLPVLKKEGVKVKFIGDQRTLPKFVREILKKTEETLKNGDRLQLNIAINYGSRAEIANAVKRLGEKEITEETIAQNLYTSEIPDPDLIIRTGGQKRLSNFLLWQSAYSELYFTDVLWPDFTEVEFEKAISDFMVRKRNFGR